MAQYYAHPANQFWRLMEAVIDIPLVGTPYPARLDALRSAGVGLWDVVRSAERIGSLDAAIRDHQPNALAEFAATLPHLRAVAFNGAKASQIGRRQLAGHRFRADARDASLQQPRPRRPVRAQARPDQN